LKKKRVGILGGSFDPAHKGHLGISKEARKLYKLKYVIWAITKKNPLKKKSNTSLNERLKSAKKIIGLNKFIKLRFFEHKINSNKSIDLINFLQKKNKNIELYFIIGADNLINFHHWHKWKKISEKTTILVFDRQGFKSKSIKSISFKKLNKKSLNFIMFKKINISSSKLRNI